MKRIIPFVLLFALLSACSKGDGEDDAVPAYNPDYNTHQNDSTKPQGNSNISYVFKGVWMVDDLKADTLSTIFRYKREYEDCEIIFLYFPYKAVFSKLFPDIKISKITASLDPGYIPEDVQLFEEIMSSSTNSINGSRYIPCRNIGISDQSLYLELMASKTDGLLYLPFVIRKDDNTLMVVILSIVPTESTVTFDRSGSSISSVLTISQVETRINGESQKKQLNPVIKLKFTSIMRFN